MKKKNFCSFYVSEYHLLTILLPYINEKMSDSKNIEVILEDDMIEYVKKYLKRNEIYNISKILKLGWKKNKEDIIELKENTDIVVICGHETFVESVNKSINNSENVKEIINCYNIETMTNLNEIVKEHNFILRTNGLCEVKKSSHNEQKRKTIQTQI
ncbi:MAG: hypothetical protein IKL55_04180 [Clostridia bacterium]|nr:hypothetical protein [Clostridia bacterium]